MGGCLTAVEALKHEIHQMTDVSLVYFTARSHKVRSQHDVGSLNSEGGTC
jgi:hypothetical protein